MEDGRRPSSKKGISMEDGRRPSSDTRDRRDSKPSKSSVKPLERKDDGYVPPHLREGFKAKPMRPIPTAYDDARRRSSSGARPRQSNPGDRVTTPAVPRPSVPRTSPDGSPTGSPSGSGARVGLFIKEKSEAKAMGKGPTKAESKSIASKNVFAMLPDDDAE
jgi:hypothetical protein